MTMTMNVSNKTMQDCLVHNNRFANKSLTADHIGSENLSVWTSLVADLHKTAYSVYALCESSNLSVDSDSVDKTAVYNSLRAILTTIGEVNGHKLYANEELATLAIGYAGKRGNDDSPELQLCLSKIRNRNKELNEYKNTNGVNPEAIKSMEKEIAELEEEKKALLDSPDNRIKKPTRTPANTFRLEVEHRLARAISEQQAKTWEQLEAEAEERRKARRAKTKDKQKAKKAESKKDDATTMPTMNDIPAEELNK